VGIQTVRAESNRYAGGRRKWSLGEHSLALGLLYLVVGTRQHSIELESSRCGGDWRKLNLDGRSLALDP
jgi:hypothetical protein